MLTRFARRSLTLAGGAVESRTSRLHDALDRSLASTAAFAWLAFAAIDQKMMLEIAGIAGGLGMIAQGRAAGSDGVFQHFADRGHQRRNALPRDAARQPLGG